MVSKPICSRDSCNTNFLQKEVDIFSQKIVALYQEKIRNTSRGERNIAGLKLTKDERKWKKHERARLHSYGKSKGLNNATINQLFKESMAKYFH